MKIVFVYNLLILYCVANRHNEQEQISSNKISSNERSHRNKLTNNEENFQNDFINNDDDLLPRPILVSNTKQNTLPTSSLNKPVIIESPSKESINNKPNIQGTSDNSKNNEDNNQANANNNKDSNKDNNKEDKCKDACKGLSDSNPSDMVKCYSECIGQPNMLLVPSNVTLPTQPTSIKKSKESDNTVTLSREKTAQVVNNSNSNILVLNELIFITIISLLL